MKKDLCKIISTILIGSILLSGCSSTGKQVAYNNSTKTNTELSHNDNKLDMYSDLAYDNGGTILLSDIKEKFGVDKDTFSIQPLYNVDPKSKFTFHFNSKVDPFQAVTVHTDSKCGLNSMLYTMNLSYFTESGGVDVIVDRYDTTTLNVIDRLDYIPSNNTWGYAAKYYLSINYDMESDTPKRLDEPIIIPFTLKNNVQTPTTSYNITDNGDFQVTWSKVDGVDGYRVYEVYKSNENNGERGDYLDREYGYVGIHPRLVAKLDKDTTSYTITDDTSLLSSSYLASQNNMVGNTYYVTAFKGEEESNFGIEVNSSKYLGQLPSSLKDPSSFIEGVEQLPEVMTVVMRNGKEIDLPVNYKLYDDLYKDAGKVTYEYSVVGTRLTGLIDYVLDENSIYEESVTSKVPMNYTIYENLDFNTIPDSSFPIINDGKATESNLTIIKDYNPNSRVVYSEEALRKIADMQAARIVTNGKFTSDPREIEVVDYNDRQNNLEERKKQLGDIFSLTNTESSETKGLVETETETESFKETETETESFKETETKEGNDKSDGEITGENVIEKQIENSENKNREGNNAEVPVVSPNYLVIADSPEEEYLALHLINQTEKIRLDTIPELMYFDYFLDVFQKVYYQNPYILGLEDTQFEYNEDTGEQYFIPIYKYKTEDAHNKQEEIYKESQRVVNEVIKDNMTDEEKVKAVWKYLEANSKYDNEALEYAKSHNLVMSEEFYNSFNTYGVLVDQVGVCQSYAYTMNLLLGEAGLNCRMLAGHVNSTLGHAWNAVELNDRWYWVDVTNNYSVVSVPFYLYLTNSEYAISNGYVLDNKYELDNLINTVLVSDNSMDWYIKNNMTAGSDEELIQKVIDEINNTEYISYAIRNINGYKPDLEDKGLYTKLYRGLIGAGIEEGQVKKIGILNIGAYTLVIKDIDLYKEQFVN